MTDHQLWADLSGRGENSQESGDNASTIVLSDDESMDVAEAQAQVVAATEAAAKASSAAAEAAEAAEAAASAEKAVSASQRKEQTLLTAFFTGSVSEEARFKFVFERDAARRAAEEAQREAQEAARAAEEARVRLLRREARRRATRARQRLEAQKREAEMQLRYEGREVIPGLFVGSRLAAQNREWLQEVADVRNVLNCTADVSCYFEGEEIYPELHTHIDQSSRDGTDIEPKGSAPHRIEYLRIAVADDSSEDLKRHFDEACRFIHAALTKAENILVHCREGRSRSVTIVIAYLMRYRKMLLAEAYNCVHDAGRITVTYTASLGEDYSETVARSSAPTAEAEAQLPSKVEVLVASASPSANTSRELPSVTSSASSEHSPSIDTMDPTLVQSKQQLVTSPSAENALPNKTAVLHLTAPIGVNDGFQRQLMAYEEELFGEKCTNWFEKNGRRGRQVAGADNFTYSDESNFRKAGVDNALARAEDSLDRLLVEEQERALHKDHSERVQIQSVDAPSSDNLTACTIQDLTETLAGKASLPTPKSQAESLASSLHASQSLQPAAAAAAAVAPGQKRPSSSTPTLRQPLKRAKPTGIKRSPKLPAQSNTLLLYFTHPTS